MATGILIMAFIPLVVINQIVAMKGSYKVNCALWIVPAIGTLISIVLVIVDSPNALITLFSTTSILIVLGGKSIATFIKG